MKEKTINFLKIAVRWVLFFAIFAMIFTYCSDMVRRQDDEVDAIYGFYGEEENTIDALFMGSSPYLRGISPNTMEANGFTSYVRASALQPPSVTYHLLAESLEYQSPELVVLFPDNIFTEYDYVEREGDLRRALDGMKISSHKIKAVSVITEADERQSMLSYLFPLFRYHDRWKEVEWGVTEPEPLPVISETDGNVPLPDTAPQEYPENFMEDMGEALPELDAESAYYFAKIIDLCAENDIEVLLLHLPKMSWSYAQSEAIANFAEEMGIDYLDMDVEEIRNQLNLDPQVDYYDQGHMNTTGSIKISEWLGEYLTSAYQLHEK
ncbi:hypothetical protein [Chakrabartyella piscis]|uniref:hypothetical protein n=1 Tax=Chakrabartyella piscis TaxID=2918914 RepID=UPI002958D0DF|nr:hypothetical protein [Chakrabartyella piscis]